ncbi:MAG: DEAD/DEAH box helicase [Proteobacteria bacterium]|nr:MAG: DEAD/DEAH box helicase [Pseudomonadota bacterium]
MSFSELGLQGAFAEHIDAAGYETPTELQQQLIPLMAQRKNALVWTQSAAGKTGAFLIPAIDYILKNPLEEHHGARVLVLTSRRDRVNQITYTIKRLLGDEQQIRTGFIVSGRPYQPQMRLLRRPLDLMIATPGRLNDLVDNNKADFSHLELLILDDLTAIYKKGLHGLIDKILAQKPEGAPIIAFVRHDEEVTPYARQIIPNAEEITIQDEKTLLQQLPQRVHLADDYTHKLALTDHLLDNLKNKPTVIFTATTKTAKTLADNLANHGHTADSTHLLPEEERNLQACPILIVPDQENFTPELSGNECIIHFEIPEKVETYQVRMQNILGVERTEPVLLLVSAHDRDHLKKLEEFRGEAIEQKSIPGLEPKQLPRSTSNRTRGNTGTRRNASNNGAKTQGNRANKQRPHNSAARKNTGSADDRQQRSRKSFYGQRKASATQQDTPYEIGSWEKQDYVPRQPRSDKKVVIRYKEKKRRTLITK